jgi:hypothetical protein
LQAGDPFIELAGNPCVHASLTRNEFRACRFVNFVLFCGKRLVEEKSGAEGERKETRQILEGGSRSPVVQDVFFE